MQAEPLDGDPPMRAVKPALKHDRSQKKKKKDLKWDEEVIAEHDQLRGTRMKIDEPNTPFHYDSGAESDGSHPKSPLSPRPTLNFDLLQDKLETMANGPDSPCPSEEDLEKKRQFREHRKNHYNEMDAVRKFRQEHSEDDGDDDDGDNDADVEDC